MCASLETLTIAAYVFATTFRLPRPGPPGKVTDAEIVALAVAQAITGTVSDRRFLGTIDRLLPGLFPDLPDQTQYNRRLRRLTSHITTVQLMLAELVAEGQVRLAARASRSAMTSSIPRPAKNATPCSSSLPRTRAAPCLRAGSGAASTSRRCN
jgi:hypothetical protein